MTYKEAVEAGYTLGRTNYSRGYVSRKSIVDNLPVQLSGRNEYYVGLPCWGSTQYYVRQYLLPPKMRRCK